MAPQPRAPATPAPVGNSHGFFSSLPRELRNAVYDLLHEDVERDVQGLQFRIRTTLPQLRLVSQQFKLEYDEQPVDNQLTITDTEDFLLYCMDDEDKVVCPPLATHKTTLHLSLLNCVDSNVHVLDHCNSQQCMVAHSDWIKTFITHLPYLRTVRVDLEVGGHCWKSGPQPEMEHLTSLPKLEELKVECYVPKGTSGVVEKELLATWTPAHGLRRNREAIDRLRKEFTNVLW